MCLKESCFSNCWKVSSVVPVFKNVGKRTISKNYSLVSLLSVVSKVFKKLINSMNVDHPEKYGLFSDFQYGFRSFWSTADLLTVLSDKIARACNSRSGASRAVSLDISKAFERVWYAFFFTDLSLMEFQVIFGHIFSLLSNRQLQVVLDGNSRKNVQLMLEFLKALFLVLHLSCYQ